MNDISKSITKFYCVPKIYGDHGKIININIKDIANFKNKFAKIV